MALKVRHKCNLLEEVTQLFIQTIKNPSNAIPLELMEVELKIPYVGKLINESGIANLADFQDISILTKDIVASCASDVRKIRILILSDEILVLGVERHEALAVS
jgi:hypothetical protein